MEKGNFSFSTDERLSPVRKRKIVYVFGVVIAGALLGTFLFFTLNGMRFTSDTSDKGLPDVLPAECPAIEDSERFDCHPDRNVTKAQCLKRGCCYREASDLLVSDFDLIDSSYIGVPSCYFPQNYNGYRLKVTQNDAVIKAQLSRTTSSGFKKDIRNVDLEITFINDNSVRLKLKDANSKRYEPDIPLYHKVVGQKNPLYDLKLDNKGLLTITRKKTGTIVFKTRLSQLIFSDQFLQLSTYTSSQYLFGFGEHKDNLLRSFNWTRLTLFNQGDIPVPHRNLYGTHPFYLVVEPDGNANGVFLRNTNAMDAILQPAPAVTLRTIGGILDLFIMLGTSPEDVVRQYTGIVGHPFMIPYWSLGFQICKYGYFSLEKTDEVLQRNLDAGVPIDVQWHDIDYMQNHLDFTFDPSNFTDLPKWVDELHRNGRHYVAMISPGVSNSEKSGTYPAYDKGKELDLFVKDPSGADTEAKVWNENYTVFPDFSNPKTESYWADRFQEFHKHLSFDGVWLDMNEPFNFDDDESHKGCPESLLENPQYLPGRPYPLRTFTICMTAKHHSTTHYNEHNLVAYREAAATFKTMKKIRQKRPFLISRASFSGQGVISGHWSGDITSDWEDLRYTIPSMLVFNMYGMPMIGSDICGFRTNTSEELCARWQALGAFYPFSRNHNDYDTIEQDPAYFGGSVLEATINTLHTRYYLLPYFYTLFYRSHAFGETVVRPLFFEFPTDKIALSNDEEFLWGPALLVIPALYPGVNEVNAYFPSGVWYDFFTGKPFVSKGQYEKLPSNITFINIAVRAGYILPLQLPGNTTTDSRENNFDLLVALNADQIATGELYWDDGDSLDTYEKGVYNLNKFTASKGSVNNTVVRHEFRSKMNMNEIKVYGVSFQPSNVTINDENVKFTFNKTKLSIDANGFSLKESFTVSWN